MDGKDKQDHVEKARANKGKPNRVAEIRKQRMMSKAELARAAGISPLTIDRVERGFSCRMDTKRKIIRALGLDLSQAFSVFPEEGEPPASGGTPVQALPAPAQEIPPQLVFPIVGPGTSPAALPPPGGAALPGGAIPPRGVSSGVIPPAPPVPVPPLVQATSVATAPYSPIPSSGAAPKTATRVTAPSGPKEHQLGEFLTAGNNSSEMQEEATGEGDVPGAS